MGIKVNELAAILEYAYDMWVNVTTGAWESNSTWNKGVTPPSGAVRVLVKNGTVYDDTTLASKQNKSIVVKDHGIFNPLSTTYAYGQSQITTATGILTGSKITLNDYGTIVFPWCNNDLGADIFVAGVTGINMAFQGVFSGQVLNSLGGSGVVNLFGDSPTADTGFFVYPKIKYLSCTDDLIFNVGPTYLGTVGGNLYPTIENNVTVPYGKLLKISGTTGTQYMIFQAGATINVAGRLKSGDHTYNTGMELLCPPANISGGGVLDCIHSQIFLNNSSFNYANIGSRITFASGGLGFANYTGSNLSIDTDIHWQVVAPGSIYNGTPGLSPTLTFRKLEAIDDGTTQGGFNMNEGSGLFTLHVREFVVAPTMTQFQFQTNSGNLTFNNIRIDSINSPVGCTLLFVPAWVTITQSTSVGGTIFVQTNTNLEVPGGVTLTTKNLTINFTPHATGTFAANTLVGFSGTGTVIVTG